jgi:hypothetical protein
MKTVMGSWLLIASIAALLLALWLRGGPLGSHPATGRDRARTLDR